MPKYSSEGQTQGQDALVPYASWAVGINQNHLGFARTLQLKFAATFRKNMNNHKSQKI
jgi:hypothetical protein